MHDAAPNYARNRWHLRPFRLPRLLIRLLVDVIFCDVVNGLLIPISRGLWRLR